MTESELEQEKVLGVSLEHTLYIKLTDDFFVCCCSGSTLGDAQGLLLILHLRIVPGGVQGPYGIL